MTSRRSHWIGINFIVVGFSGGKRTEKSYELTFLVKEKEEIFDILRQFALENDFTAVLNIQVTGMRMESQCYGCRTDQPNQQAHEEQGGCLYNPKSLSKSK